MHREILSPEQLELLPFVRKFSRRFGLVGGTAIALHLGHRESIDFDLFSHKPFKNIALLEQVQENIKHVPIRVLVNRGGEFTFFAGSVKATFFTFPYELPFEQRFEDVVRLPTLLTLAAMKAFAMGQRSKWKDYVDLYFILRDHYSIEEISRKAEELFGEQFNAKIFRTQLSYFDDVNYEEKVVYLPGFAVPDEEVKAKLTEYSME